MAFARLVAVASAFAMAGQMVSAQLPYNMLSPYSGVPGILNNAYMAPVAMVGNADAVMLPQIPLAHGAVHPYFSGPSYAQRNQMMHTQYVNVNQLSSTVQLHQLAYTTMEKKGWDHALGLGQHPFTKANDAMHRFVLKDILNENKIQKSLVSKALAEVNADIKRFPKEAHEWSPFEHQIIASNYGPVRTNYLQPKKKKKKSKGK